MGLISNDELIQLITIIKWLKRNKFDIKKLREDNYVSYQKFESLYNKYFKYYSVKFFSMNFNTNNKKVNIICDAYLIRSFDYDFTLENYLFCLDRIYSDINFIKKEINLLLKKEFNLELLKQKINTKSKEEDISY